MNINSLVNWQAVKRLNKVELQDAVKQLEIDTFGMSVDDIKQEVWNRIKGTRKTFVPAPIANAWDTVKAQVDKMDAWFNEHEALKTILLAYYAEKRYLDEKEAVALIEKFLVPMRKEFEATLEVIKTRFEEVEARVDDLDFNIEVEPEPAPEAEPVIKKTVVVEKSTPVEEKPLNWAQKLAKAGEKKA